MIDPQGQANKWVKKMESTSSTSLRVVKLNQATFARTLEMALQIGSPVLIENIAETLDPILEPILLKQIVTTSGKSTVRFGDATVEYNPQFRLYMTTKFRNPHYAPETVVRVNLLNFMATVDGLQDQMLGICVANEEPELEAQREQLVLEDAEHKRQLKEIEDQILYLLKTAEGNILDDETLIDTLAQSKVTSNQIEQKVKIGLRTHETIGRAREGYKPVAFHASQIFFCIAELSMIDPMYQYSMEWFINLFIVAIKQAEKGENLEERLGHLNATFTHILYRNVCRSLFEKDKLLFSFLLCTKIMIANDRLELLELRYLLQGNTAMDHEREMPTAHDDKTKTKWLSEKTWGDLLALEKLPAPVFEGFVDTFVSQIDRWEAVFYSKQPAVDMLELLPLAEGTAAAGTSTAAAVAGAPADPQGAAAAPGVACTPFQLLCVLRAVRPDVVVPNVMEFVANEMGRQFIEPPQFDLGSCYEDSTCATPLIFVLTPGADPMTELYKIADELGFGAKRLLVISMGQGQGDIAFNAIQEAQDKGTWVCLQNCHLCVSWMPTLERICEELSPDRVHANFRLWLTSEPSPHFPAYILQNGVKMTNEPPKGMRANLMGSYHAVDDEFFDGCLNAAAFKKLLFGLCFFHATVRERRKFGSLGWNISYVFSSPDLRISIDQLRIFLDEIEPVVPTSPSPSPSGELNGGARIAIPYAALNYLVGECNYGGRVTDDKDRRCLLNILSDFYNASIVENDRYVFSPSGTYFAPPEGTLEETKDYIRELPYSEGPEVFGLHDNANISCAISEVGRRFVSVSHRHHRWQFTTPCPVIISLAVLTRTQLTCIRSPFGAHVACS